MTTQQDERAELIRKQFETWANDQGFQLHPLRDGPDYLDVRTQSVWEAWQAAALLQADAEVGGEAVAWQTRSKYCPDWTACSKEFYEEFRIGKAVHGVEVRELFNRPQQAAQVPPEIQAVIEAARQWWCDRAPQNWDDAELAKAVIRLDGDWPGCPGCDHECDEPCMPATMQEQLHAVDCHVAQLVHEGKLHPGDDYTPPTGWEPKPYPKKAAHGIGKDQG